MSYLLKKVKIPVHLDGDEQTPPKDFFLFYSFACGEYLLEKYGSPQAADKALYDTFMKYEDGVLVQKSDDERDNAGLIRVLKEYVHGLTITWAKQAGSKPIDIMDESVDDMATLLGMVAKAIGIAMPEVKEGEAKKDPRKP